MKWFILTFILFNLFFRFGKAQAKETKCYNDLVVCYNTFSARIEDPRFIFSRTFACEGLYDVLECYWTAVSPCPEARQYYIHSMGTLRDAIVSFCSRFTRRPPPPSRTAGGFGDPHLQLLNGTMVTCSLPGVQTLYSTKDLNIAMETFAPNPKIPASTAIRMLVLTFSNPFLDWSCNITAHYFPAEGVYGSGSGNSVTVQGRQITFEGSNVMVDVRVSNNALLFGIAAPMTEDAKGVLVKGCDSVLPPGSPTSQRNIYTAADNSACSKFSGYAKAACNYDVETTNDTAWAQTPAIFDDIGKGQQSYIDNYGGLVAKDCIDARVLDIHYKIMLFVACLLCIVCCPCCCLGTPVCAPIAFVCGYYTLCISLLWPIAGILYYTYNMGINTAKIEACRLANL